MQKFNTSALLIMIFIGSSLAFTSNRTNHKVAIYGGYTARANEATYTVLIKRDLKNLCGGALLTAKHVLTSAHCLMGNDGKLYNNLIVIAGTQNKFKGGIENRPAKMFVHPLYPRQFVVPDIGIIELQEAFPLSRKITLVSLPKKPITSKEKVLVSGFGTTSDDEYKQSPFLKAYSSEALTTEDCNKIYTKIPDRTHTITISDICEIPDYGTGTCFGDSGSPMVNFQKEIVGVVSRGDKCAVGYPNIYASVYYSLNFISNCIQTNDV